MDSGNNVNVLKRLTAQDIEAIDKVIGTVAVEDRYGNVRDNDSDRIIYDNKKFPKLDNVRLALDFLLTHPVTGNTGTVTPGGTNLTYIGSTTAFNSLPGINPTDKFNRLFSASGGSVEGDVVLISYVATDQDNNAAGFWRKNNLDIWEHVVNFSQIGLEKTIALFDPARNYKAGEKFIQIRSVNSQSEVIWEANVNVPANAWDWDDVEGGASNNDFWKPLSIEESAIGPEVYIRPFNPAKGYSPNEKFTQLISASSTVEIIWEAVGVVPPAVWDFNDVVGGVSGNNYWKPLSIPESEVGPEVYIKDFDPAKDYVAGEKFVHAVSPTNSDSVIWEAQTDILAGAWDWQDIIGGKSNKDYWKPLADSGITPPISPDDRETRKYSWKPGIGFTWEDDRAGVIIVQNAVERNALRFPEDIVTGSIVVQKDTKIAYIFKESSEVPTDAFITLDHGTVLLVQIIPVILLILFLQI